MAKALISFYLCSLRVNFSVPCVNLANVGKEAGTGWFPIFASFFP